MHSPSAEKRLHTPDPHPSKMLASPPSAPKRAQDEKAQGGGRRRRPRRRRHTALAHTATSEAAPDRCGAPTVVVRWPLCPSGKPRGPVRGPGRAGREHRCLVCGVRPRSGLAATGLELHLSTASPGYGVRSGFPRGPPGHPGCVSYVRSLISSKRETDFLYASSLVPPPPAPRAARRARGRLRVFELFCLQ